MFWLWVALGGGLLVLVVAAVTLGRSRSSSSGVIEVRSTPRREVEQMTVNEFRRLALTYLRSRGYEITDPDAESPRGRRGEKEYLIHFDPADEAKNPRTINQLVARQRRAGVDGLVLVTTAELGEKSARLTERAPLEVLDPPTLIGWRRERDSSGGTGSPDSPGSP